MNDKEFRIDVTEQEHLLGLDDEGVPADLGGRGARLLKTDMVLIEDLGNGAGLLSFGKEEKTHEESD